MQKIGRKLLVGGNWKCNNTIQQSKEIVNEILNKLQFDNQKVEVVVSPVNIHLGIVQQELKNKNIQISAQNSSSTLMGAYTGEVNVQQLLDLGLKWVILGHSERRQYFNETNEVVAGKVKLAIENGLNVIGCIGEQLKEREDGETMKVVNEQLDAFIGKLSQQDWNNLVIAYEPVWAIGTGKVATPQQAQEVHQQIRSYIQNKVGHSQAQALRILYGGSVNAKNSDQLIQLPDVDGFLVGGASLKPEFIDIVKSCNNVIKS